MLAFPVGFIPVARRASESDIGCCAGARKRVSGSSHNDYLGVGVAADIAECLGELTVGRLTPLKGPVIGMEGDLEDAVLPLHMDGLVFLGILVKLCHGSLPIGFGGHHATSQDSSSIIGRAPGLARVRANLLDADTT